MTRETIKEAQKFLIVCDDDRVRKIVDIEILLKRHQEEMVIAFLKDLHKETERKLRIIISKDKSSKEVDLLIAKLFRLRMCIKTMESSKEKEVRKAA